MGNLKEGHYCCGEGLLFVVPVARAERVMKLLINCTAGNLDLYGFILAAL